MSCKAFYHLPDAEEIVMLQQDGEPELLHDYTQLTGHSGFVVAPFQCSRSCPIVVIKPDKVEHMPYADCLRDHHPAAFAIAGDDTPDHERDHYHEAFIKFHEPLQQGTFRKIVLSRRTDYTLRRKPDLVEHFLHTCALNPHTFVALVAWQPDEAWLVATPEVLLSGDRQSWHTMALAGTMKQSERRPWKEKEKREQAYVTDYIADCLHAFSDNVTQGTPHTIVAGGLQHLRTDFIFTLKEDAPIGALLQQLHPTPAVCGIPKQPTIEFILQNEPSPRLYYSGFMGPLMMEGKTHLYVSLRCMHVNSLSCSLYAGGGLLSESREDDEWAETNDKMETMRSTWQS